MPDKEITTCDFIRVHIPETSGLETYINTSGILSFRGSYKFIDNTCYDIAEITFKNGDKIEVEESVMELKELLSVN